MYARTSFGPEKNDSNYVNFFTQRISTLKYKWSPRATNPAKVLGLIAFIQNLPTIKLFSPMVKVIRFLF